MSHSCWHGGAPAQTGLYLPAQTYSTAVLDNYTVRDIAHSRDIPILIRYPLGTSGPLPMILWSHGGGAQVNGKHNAAEADCDPPRGRFGQHHHRDAPGGAVGRTGSPSRVGNPPYTVLLDYS